MSPFLWEKVKIDGVDYQLCQAFDRQWLAKIVENYNEKDFIKYIKTDICGLENE